MENVLTAGMLDSAPGKEKEKIILSVCDSSGHFDTFCGHGNNSDQIKKQLNFFLKKSKTKKKIILAFNGFNKCNGNKHY